MTLVIISTSLVVLAFTIIVIDFVCTQKRESLSKRDISDSFCRIGFFLLSVTVAIFCMCITISVITKPLVEHGRVLDVSLKNGAAKVTLIKEDDEKTITLYTYPSEILRINRGETVDVKYTDIPSIKEAGVLYALDTRSGSNFWHWFGFGLAVFLLLLAIEDICVRKREYA